MRAIFLIAITAMIALQPGLAEAGKKHCPPGLAKKQNGCLPPGQAKKIYAPGDHIHHGYSQVRHPGRHGLDADETYYRVGDYVYRVDRDTREVLDLIGAVAQILN